MQVLCFHLGMTECFAWDYGEPTQRFTDYKETEKILNEIHHEIVKDGGKLQYSHHVNISIAITCKVQAFLSIGCASRNSRLCIVK